MANLLTLARLLWTTAPPVSRMKGSPGYQNWARDLAEVAQAATMAPLRGVLTEMAETALSTSEPLDRFLNGQAAAVPLDVYVAAAHRANDMADRSPAAALVLSYVSLSGWASSIGLDHLYGQDAFGMPDSGWSLFPYVLASIGVRIGALKEAQRIIDHGYDVLLAAKHQQDPALRRALERYRTLGRTARARYENAIRSLADDLRDACRADEPNMRPEFGAILWTLGLIPQSGAFERDVPVRMLPTRRLCSEVVRQSMETIPHDRLLQYIWLEVKDREPLPLREHQELFAIINNRFGEDLSYYLLTTLLQDEPARLYARTLIRWFRGDLSRDAVETFIKTRSSLAGLEQDSNMVALRMLYLGFVLGSRLGWPSGFDSPNEEDLRLLNSWSRQGASVRRALEVQPDFRDLQGAMNLSLFELVERHLSSGRAAGMQRAWDTLEGFRASALTYWMTVTPPTPAPAEEAAAAALLERERDLLREFRGAYFLSLYDHLPQHYRRYAAPNDVFWDSTGERRRLDSDRGRGEYRRLQTELTALFEQMKPLAPTYSKKRRQQAASWADLLKAIRNHSARCSVTTTP